MLRIWATSRSSRSVLKWRGTWRSTYLAIPKTHLTQICCKNLFSDVLHRPFLCAHTPLISYVNDIPAQNLIPRLSDLSPPEYLRSWTNKPFILTDPVRGWPAYQNWSLDGLLKKYANVEFRAEAVDWPFETYMDYMNNNQDESPLYLFDRSFVEKMNIAVGKEFEGQYWTPECFGEDFFAALEAQRPDHRWLIIGPERSGSTFHKDPNATRYVQKLPSMHGNTFESGVVHGMLFFAVPNIGLCFQRRRHLRLLRESLSPRIRVK